MTGHMDRIDSEQELLAIRECMGRVQQLGEQIAGHVLNLKAAGVRLPALEHTAQLLAGIALGWQAGEPNMNNAQPPISPAGYLRGLRGLLGQTATTNVQRDPDDPYDPDEDPPWTVIDKIRLTDDE